MASASTSKKDAPAAEPKAEQQTTQKKPAAALEEDDEFEDFPVDGMYCHASSFRLTAETLREASPYDAANGGTYTPIPYTQ